MKVINMLVQILEESQMGCYVELFQDELHLPSNLSLVVLG